SGKDKILILNDLLLEYSEKDFNKALDKGNIALKMARAEKDEFLEATVCLNLGNINYEHCEYEIALNRFREALSLFKKNNNTNLIDINYAINNIAVIYDELGQYTNALSYYLESLKIAEKINDREGKASAIVNIGSFYDSIGMYNKALEYLTNALYLFKLEEDKDGIAVALGNLSSTYLNLDDYDKALEFQLESLALEKENKNISGMGISYGTIADIYLELTNYNKAIENYNKCIELAKSIDNKDILCGALGGTGKIYFESKQYEKALKYNQQALDIALKIGKRENMCTYYKALSTTYCSMGHHHKALKMFKKYDEIKDELYCELLTKQMVKMESKYKSEKQQYENDLLKSRNQFQKLKLQRFQVYIFLSIAVIIILVLAVTLLLYTIKKRKIAENELFKSRKQYKTIFDNSPLGIAFYDKDSIFVSANDKFLDILGATRENIKGINLLKYVVDKKIRDTLQIALKGKQSVYEGEYLSVITQKRCPVRCTFNCVEDASGKIAGIICVVEDITERMNAEKEKQKLENQLERSRKMETIGLLAGGVAHDLNNVLSGIVSYPDLLLMDIPDSSPLKRPLITIKQAGERAAAIVQDLLSLARRGVNTTKVLDLNNVINEFTRSPECEILKSYHPNFTIKSNLCVKPDNIKGSEVHLKKMLMNLVTNAAEADGTIIEISTRNIYIDKPIKGYDNINEGHYIVLTISDNGTGMSPNDLKNIFEPFYTKKVMGRSGTGLGMSVVWSTIQDHNGNINIKSIEGQGTIIEIYFPLTEEEMNDEITALPVEKYMGNGDTILIIDDIYEQREIAKNILEKLGYSVQTVSSGEDAVEFVKHNQPDIIVLDMLMAGGINGLETFKRILKIRPGQKAIIASGFSESRDVKEAQQLGAGSYIKKPYNIENIGMAVKKELRKNT
ncbi:tetratricopeptide repeat protein, partial [bacterium]|nr:tetratricopeptide repeat protein [bacterium]